MYEAVAIAILNCTSFHSLCCLVNRKVKYLKQTVFLSEQCATCQKLRLFEVQSFGLDTGPQFVLPLVYCPVDNGLFEVSPEICRSGVSSRYCCYGTQLVLGQLKNFYRSQLRIE